VGGLDSRHSFGIATNSHRAAAPGAAQKRETDGFAQGGDFGEVLLGHEFFEPEVGDAIRMGSMPFCVELDLSSNGVARRHCVARLAQRGWQVSA
jgi:hypothetical protein